jgi:hypothetical protein
MDEMEIDNHTTKGAVDRLLAGVESGDLPNGIFSDDAVLDATVPNWRLSIRGGCAIRDQLSKWYADAGKFESLERTPIPGGELVEFTLTWIEDGVDHMVHQAHILSVVDNFVASDTVFCGGRWPASLVAEMQKHNY